MNRHAVKAVKPKNRIKLWNIAVGDTVKVISGPSKGTVGKVQECIWNQNKVVVSGVNVVKKLLPAFLAQKTGLEGQKFEYPSAIHYSNVQLVGEIPSATDYNGPKRMVEIKRIHTGKTFYNKDKKMLTWRRWIPGENVFLPWPKQDVTHVDGPMDTKQKEVNVATYIETLRQSPIPVGMEDELRNRHSKFREEAVNAAEVAVEDVKGIEETGEVTDDLELAQTKPTKPRSDPTGGLKPTTINFLAQAMFKRTTPSAQEER